MSQSLNETASVNSARERLELVPLVEQARILELTHDTVIIRDVHDVILYWNRGAEALYGYTRDEAVGVCCSDLLHCDFPSMEVNQALQAEGHWSGEMTRVHRNGTRITLASRWLQRRDDSGFGIGVMETSADVTDRKRAEADRERTEMRYSAIFHAAGFATWESDWSQIRRFVEEVASEQTNLRDWLTSHPDVVRMAASKALIREVNQATLDLFEARSPEDLVGTSIIGRYPVDAERGFVEILLGLVEGRDVVEAETRLSTLFGRPLDVILRATLVPDGEPWSRALVMAFDETERKEARAKLAQTSAELAHASRVSMLGQLAASIAHEVNQPLAAIVNYGKSGQRWLAREVPQMDEAKICLERIVANGSRAADIISGIRTLARKSMPSIEPLALLDLVEDGISLVGREAAESGVTVRRKFDLQVPMVLGDRVQIQQVVVNLLLNGMQAMRAVTDRKKELCVMINADRKNGMVHVAVQDCGSGIGGDDPARIFTPFFTTKADGMGMGLSICRSIIEAQGGRITATDNPDHGATIAFTLPAHT